MLASYVSASDDNQTYLSPNPVWNSIRINVGSITCTEKKNLTGFSNIDCRLTVHGLTQRLRNQSKTLRHERLGATNCVRDILQMANRTVATRTLIRNLTSQASGKPQSAISNWIHLEAEMKLYSSDAPHGREGLFVPEAFFGHVFGTLGPPRMLVLALTRRKCVL